MYRKSFRIDALMPATACSITVLFGSAAMGASTLPVVEAPCAENRHTLMMKDFAAGASSSDRLAYFFRHFRDLFDEEEQYAARDSGIALNVTAAVFGSGHTGGSGLGFGSAGAAPGNGNGFTGNGMGNGNALGGNAGPGADAGPGGASGFAGGGGGGGVAIAMNDEGIEFAEMGDGGMMSGCCCCCLSAFEDYDGRHPWHKMSRPQNGDHTTPIPLPASLWLGLIGLAGVGWNRRRTRLSSGV